MRKFVIATALILAPVAAFAQSTAGAETSTPPTTHGTYGPPAPTPIPTGSNAPTARPATTASDDAQPKTRHHGGHRRGGYMGTDAGATPR